MQFEVKKNGFTPETEEEIGELVTKNFLKSQNIAYHRIGEDVGKIVATEEEQTTAAYAAA